MSLNKRERALLAVVVGLLVLVAGNYVLNSVLLGPLEAKDREIASLEQQERDRRLDWDRFVRDRQRLETWLRQSLPPDPNVAQTLYQGWLVDLAQRSGLQRATVTPNQIADRGHYHELPFSVQARGSLASLTRFLYDFFDADLLHQVRRISITPVRQGGMTTLDIGLSVEALSLTEAAPRTTLFPEGGEQQPSGRLAEDELVAYQQVLGRDVFAPFVPQPPRGEGDTFDTASYVYLVGVVGVGNRREAWLYDRINDRQYRLRTNGEYAIAGIQMTMREIAERSVVLETENGPHRMSLGTNLRDALQGAE